MTETKIINKSNYDKDFHKKIACYHLRYSINRLTAFLVIITLTVLAIQSYTLKEYTSAIVMACFGLIIFPISFFLLPYIINISRYKTLLKRGNGQPFIMTIELNDKEIRYKSSLNETGILRYDHIKDIIIYKNILIITDLNNKPLYLREDSYIRQDKESCHILLEKKTKMNIKEDKKWANWPKKP